LFVAVRPEWPPPRRERLDAGPEGGDGLCFHARGRPRRLAAAGLGQGLWASAGNRGGDGPPQL